MMMVTSLDLAGVTDDPPRGALKNYTRDVRSLAHRFLEHCELFEHPFIVRGKDVGAHVQSCLSDLLRTQQR